MYVSNDYWLERSNSGGDDFEAFTPQAPRCPDCREIWQAVPNNSLFGPYFGLMNAKHKKTRIPRTYHLGINSLLDIHDVCKFNATMVYLKVVRLMRLGSLRKKFISKKRNRQFLKNYRGSLAQKLSVGSKYILKCKKYHTRSLSAGSVCWKSVNARRQETKNRVFWS